MTSSKYYDSDEIPELSSHHSGVYDEDQLEKNELKNNSMIELELAMLRVTQLEKEIELEKLSPQKCEGSGQLMNYVSDLNSSRTIETVVLKLPTHIQQEWLTVAYKIIRGGREPLFTDLVEFVKEQAGIANTRYGLLVTGDPSNRNQRQSVAGTKRHLDSEHKARVSFANTSESDVTPYVRPRTLGLSYLLCTGNHRLDQCERFRDKNVNERIEFVSKKKLFNVCLKANHIARNCRAPRSYAVERCGWRHHTLLHRKREEQGDNNNNAHINTQLCTEKSVERVQKQAAFVIVPVLEELEDKFEQLYSTEVKDPFSRTTSMSVEDRIALSAISNSVQRLNRHYQIALPWRHKHKLPNNRELAGRRPSCLKGRLIRDKKLFQDYVDSVTRYVERDYAEKINDNHSHGQLWYLPHHPVFHLKKTNKLRIVFDCAAQ
ncbi:unnamed protein product [Schistosoma mattheei]|uniref:Uncharacterized protein n=1 Tax=Schistosoma mattheei TaxID=31246 RepID=A0A183NMB0_9TREM|nr:unnamed protein product [Schistosoma mattheei]